MGRHTNTKKGNAVFNGHHGPLPVQHLTVSSLLHYNNGCLDCPCHHRLDICLPLRHPSDPQCLQCQKAWVRQGSRLHFPAYCVCSYTSQSIEFRFNCVVKITGDSLLVVTENGTSTSASVAVWGLILSQLGFLPLIAATNSFIIRW